MQHGEQCCYSVATASPVFFFTWGLPLIDMPEEDRDGGRMRRKNCPTPVEIILFMNTCCALFSSVMLVIIEVKYEIVIVNWNWEYLLPSPWHTALLSSEQLQSLSAGQAQPPTVLRLLLMMQNQSGSAVGGTLSELQSGGHGCIVSLIYITTLLINE